MKNEKNKRAIIVGLFITIGLAILIVTIFTMGGEKKSFSKKISVRAQFTDISGLQEGDNIWFSGVKIGTVKKIDLEGNAKVVLTLHIDEKAQPFIKKDSKVKISSDGFIGNKLVVIFGGSQTSPPVAENDLLQAVSIASTEDMFTTLQANNQNLLAITSEFKEIAKKINSGQGTLGTLISNNEAAIKLNNTLENFRKTSLASKKAVNDISAFTAELNDSTHSLHQLVKDTVITNVLRGSIVQLREATYTASQFVDQLKAAAEQINDPSSPLGVLLKDQNAAEQLRQTISNLQSGSKKLDEDLEALQHNFLLRGFFKKKEKEQQKQQK
jgi:phospholipid/cholesterol/gamma-HCH transport system substrate-binding protein